MSILWRESCNEGIKTNRKHFKIGGVYSISPLQKSNTLDVDHTL